MDGHSPSDGFATIDALRDPLENDIENSIGNNIRNNIQSNIQCNVQNNVQNNVQSNVQNNVQSNVEHLDHYETTTLELEPEALEELFHALRRRLYGRARRLYGVGGYDLDSLVGEALLDLARRHRAGKLRARISNRYLDFSVREAFRHETRAQVRNCTVPVGSLDALGAMASTRPDPCTELGDGTTPSLARELRERFHVEGGWTARFERHLEDALRSQGLGEEGASLEQRVVDWIARNADSDVYHSEIADALGAARESVSRSLGRLRRNGTVIREGGNDRRSRYRLA